MSVEKTALLWGALAAADLSARQYTFAKFDSNGKFVAAGAGEAGFVLQDAPVNGGQGTVCLLGVTKVICGGSVSAMGQLTGDGNAKAVAATDGDVVNAIALKGGSSGDVIPALAVFCQLAEAA